jgi:hypothetical protein
LRIEIQRKGGIQAENKGWVRGPEVACERVHLRVDFLILHPVEFPAVVVAVVVVMVVVAVQMLERWRGNNGKCNTKHQ